MIFKIILCGILCTFIFYIISYLINRILVYFSGFFVVWVNLIIYDHRIWFKKGTTIEDIYYSISIDGIYKEFTINKWYFLYNLIGPLIVCPLRIVANIFLLVFYLLINFLLISYEILKKIFIYKIFANYSILIYRVSKEIFTDFLYKINNSKKKIKSFILNIKVS